ncbi:efflux RND transporter permease subunit [Halieaceae bacterium IMCC14734]|uniref:Efflux RND transporter permease subunit n=1 Tax=Candidatus Litorirhabdus singularis TaxID=2518993 RepID=A0ABT3TBK0_9GAMM|nr:efflux RND transporter permease subunit [Candidatus Litorirhabdus singularis]MCX2979575.1 efflux RND transporter permease subunit [Candidatus Litorirhabdus singularis]
MKGAIAWFAHNPVAANLLLGLIVLSGLVAVANMPQKSFPDIDVPVISISVPYLGAAPEEVEQGVCIRIEEELEGVEGIKTITSNANEGLCSVSVELLEDADTGKALDDVKNRVDAIDTFPVETEKPIVNLVSIVRTVLDIAVIGPAEERTLKVIGEQVRDDIAKLPGVTQVELSNTRPYEISIEVSEASLRRHGLSFDDVAGAVRSRSLDLPGGSIKTIGGEILLRTQGQAYWGRDFEQLIIRTAPDGTRLYLRDVATIVDGFADTDQMLRFDGRPAALIRVSRIGNQDIMDITRTVQDYLDTSASRLPEGVELTVWNDGSKLLQDRLETLLDSARQGFLMVLIVLALFLRPRLAFWVSVGVPVAFLGAIFAIYILGLSIDAISLFGFILVLGILVDDAIVVGEKVHSVQQETGDLLEGAVLGTQQVSLPVIFGVLTTVATFTPLLLGPGSFGQIFGVVATVVMCCLAFSLIESQLILPSHLGHSKSGSPSSEVGLLMIPIVAIALLEFSWDVRSYIGLAVLIMVLLYLLHLAGVAQRVAALLVSFQQQISARIELFISVTFRGVVERAVAARYVVIALAMVAFLSAVGILGSGRLPFSFFPPLESDQAIAALTMPLGTPVAVTDAAVLHLEKTAQLLQLELDNEFPAASPVTHILSAVGSQPSSAGGGAVGGGGHLGEVTLQLTPSQSRSIDTRTVANRWRELAGPIPDAVELKFSTAFFTAGNAIDIQLAGANVEDLRIVAAKLREQLGTYPGVIDITDSFRSGKQELKLDVRPSGEALGLSLETLARQVRQAFYGEEAQRIQRGRDDVRVMVRYTDAERRSLATLEDMRIRTPEGAEVPFRTVASAELGRGYSTIRRADRQRVVSVVADVDRSQITANEVIADLGAGFIEEIMREYPRITYSLEGEQAEQGEAIGKLVPMFGIALFVIFALLAVPLRSYVQPLIIMSVIPFAFVGAIWGHVIMKNFGLVAGLAMPSIMGFIAASGVVVNSSLVLVHQINQSRKQGVHFHDAVLMAAQSRCRPIVLTALTTFVGLLPLMFNTSVQAQFLVPMAVSLAFGVAFATVVTLLVVPSGYIILEDLNRFMSRNKSASDGDADELVSEQQ